VSYCHRCGCEHGHHQPWCKDLTGWHEYIAVTREWLEHYPEDIFTGVSGDPGALFIVAIRKALKELDEYGH